MFISDWRQELLRKLSATRELTSELFPLRNLARKLDLRTASIESLLPDTTMSSAEPAHPPARADQHLDYPAIPDPYQQQSLSSEMPDARPSTPAFALEPPAPPGSPSLPMAVETPADEICAAIFEAQGVQNQLDNPNFGLEQILDPPFGEDPFLGPRGAF